MKKHEELKMEAAVLICQRNEAIDGTAEHYNSNNRAVNDRSHKCQYITKDGQRCAIGRLVDESLATAMEADSGVISGPRLLAMLPPEIRGLGRAFLRDLQLLHDRCENWTVNGLSRQGELRVNVLKFRYCDPIGVQSEIVSGDRWKD